METITKHTAQLAHIICPIAHEEALKALCENRFNAIVARGRSIDVALAWVETLYDAEKIAFAVRLRGGVPVSGEVRR